MVKFLKTIFFCTLIILLRPVICMADVKFDRINGSDLVMGIGGRAVGMGGAFVSIADDASAVFWNPAGLTQLNSDQIYLSAYIPADMSAAACIHKPAWAPLKRQNFTMALGWVNRLSFKGNSGSDTWEGYPYHLLDLAMLDVGDNYSGRIDSKTSDLRLSLAMTPEGFQKLSLGVNLIHIS